MGGRIPREKMSRQPDPDRAAMMERGKARYARDNAVMTGNDHGWTYCQYCDELRRVNEMSWQGAVYLCRWCANGGEPIPLMPPPVKRARFIEVMRPGSGRQFILADD